MQEKKIKISPRKKRNCLRIRACKILEKYLNVSVMAHIQQAFAYAGKLWRITALRGGPVAIPW